MNKKIFSLVLSHIPASDKSAHKYVLASIIKHFLAGSELVELHILLVGRFRDGKFIDLNKGVSLSFFENLFNKEELSRINIDIFEGRSCNSEEDYFQHIEYKLAENNPCAVIHSRDNCQILGLDKFLFNKFVTIQFPFNSSNKITPWSDFVITHFKSTYSHKNQKLIAYQQYIYFNADVLNSKPCSTDKKKLISIVGNDRISRSLKSNSSEIEDFFCFLISENLNWTIVGESSISNLSGINKYLDELISLEMVSVIPSSDDVISILKSHDIYIQPPFVTGGGRVAAVESTSCGLPVVLFGDADCQQRLLCKSKTIDFKDGMKYLRSLVLNNDYYKNESRKVLENIFNISRDIDNSPIAELVEILTLD